MTHEINPAFAEAVRNGTYKKVSLSFFPPNSPANPVPGSWYPKHIGFLGGAAPAVAGLANVQFSSDAGQCPTFSVDFGNPGFEQTASLLRMLRDFFIEKFGLDEADKALPGYQIEWLNDATYTTPNYSDLPSFSAGGVIPNPKPKRQEPPKVTTIDPAFAAREADVASREERLKKRERELTHSDNVSFAEALVTDGKLIAASKDQVVAILDALPAETSVSFAEGQAAVPLSKAIRDILSAQPKVVSFGKVDLPLQGSEKPVAFASDGREVDTEKLELHHKAVLYQRANPGTQYLDAVRAVS